MLVRHARVYAARGLRWLAARLRDDEVVVDEEASVELAPEPPAVVEPEPAPAPAPAAPAVREEIPDDDPELIRGRVEGALHTIYDPEIPVDIYDLGLIYEIDVREDRGVGVKMTLTSPNCPAAQSLPAEVERKVSAIPAVAYADVDVVFDPPWTPDLMSEEAKLELNIA
ncbi:MAG: DUF59 domain-containing protein [Alphaproteobacteria bacterium]|nr:DUF59 domain-containing protein [Alphaproteobacteria bacterium]